MANFDEDIKRITDEILSDGTVDQIIREKVTDGIEKAIASSFNYGKLEKAVKERVEQVLVPFIENYDMSAYIVKLDTVLTEIVNKSVLMDNKQMLENFQYLMKEPQITEIKLTDLFKEYKKFVARNMEISGRKVEWDESPEYEAMTAFFEFEEEGKRIWSSFKCSYDCRMVVQRKINPYSEGEFQEREGYENNGGVYGYIYHIYNRSTNMHYIGQTVYMPFFRWQEHVKSGLKGDITDLIFETITEVRVKSQEYLNNIEAWWIQKYIHDYGRENVMNITTPKITMEDLIKEFDMQVIGQMRFAEVENG